LGLLRWNNPEFFGLFIPKIGVDMQVGNRRVSRQVENLGKLLPLTHLTCADRLKIEEDEVADVEEGQ
jgi:TctA family transporter